ncbi:MAG: hypothetical protein HDQ98_14780 [Lachnospiraceae bacterium]|nr:hypothetical protein [Lachnospiraceae bacterium]
MNKFDKKVKEMAKEIQTPASYDKKVDGLLQSLTEQEELPHQKSGGRKRVLQFAFCLVCVFLILSFFTIGTQANFFSSFKETIIDFLTGDSDEDPANMGIESDQNYAESKPDLIIALSEKVIDSHSIYLLVEITAPNHIRFTPDISFDYFCFCWGTNYNVDQLISGVTSCELLEVSEDMPNRATYVVSLVTDEELEEEKDITVCFQDLTAGPNSDHPALLVGGVWSMTFPIYRTVTDNIAIEGDPSMTFSYINTTAEVKSIELTPLGMVVVSDISQYPSDMLGVSDTTISMRLRMIDGSEPVLVSHDPDEAVLTRSGSFYFTEIDGKTCQQDTLEFTNAINIDKVLGIYIEDLYIPVRE